MQAADAVKPAQKHTDAVYIGHAGVKRPAAVRQQPVPKRGAIPRPPSKTAIIQKRLIRFKASILFNQSGHQVTAFLNPTNWRSHGKTRTSHGRTLPFKDAAPLPSAPPAIARALSKWCNSIPAIPARINVSRFHPSMDGRPVGQQSRTTPPIRASYRQLADIKRQYRLLSQDVQSL